MEGGLGFQSTSAVAELAHAASWMQCLGGLRERLQEDDVGLLQSHIPDLAAALKAARHLADELGCSHLIGEIPRGEKSKLTQKSLVTKRSRDIINEWFARPSISPSAKAWVRSCGGKGGGFLRHPKCDAHKMEDLEFERAVQLRLHGDVLSGGTSCPFRSAAVARSPLYTIGPAPLPPSPAPESTQQAPCPCRLDTKAIHTLSCPRAGGLVRRHDTLARTGIRSGFQALGCESILCEQLTTPDTSGFAPRVDLAAVAPDGRQVQIDVVVAHPCSVEALAAHSARTSGAAARLAERDKETTYGTRNVVAAAFETGGRAGDGFTELISTLLPQDPGERSRAAADFWQRVSVVLQRENARTINLARRGASQ